MAGSPFQLDDRGRFIRVGCNDQNARPADGAQRGPPLASRGTGEFDDAVGAGDRPSGAIFG